VPADSTSPDRVGQPARTAGVLLAAGMSRRVGQLKQALDWSGRSILRHVAETLLAAGLRPVCVVLGHERVRLARELAGLDVHVVENPAYESGMFSSVRCGLAALPPDATSCVIALVDQPRVTADVIRQLVGEHLRHAAAVTMPRFGAETGHPVVLARRVVDAALAADPTATLRDVLAGFAEHAHYVDVETDSVVSDIDTMSDYERQRPSDGIPWR